MISQVFISINCLFETSKFKMLHISLILLVIVIASIAVATSDTCRDQCCDQYSRIISDLRNQSIGLIVKAGQVSASLESNITLESVILRTNKFPLEDINKGDNQKNVFDDLDGKTSLIGDKSFAFKKQGDEINELINELTSFESTLKQLTKEVKLHRFVSEQLWIDTIILRYKISEQARRVNILKKFFKDKQNNKLGIHFTPGRRLSPPTNSLAISLPWYKSVAEHLYLSVDKAVDLKRDFEEQEGVLRGMGKKIRLLHEDLDEAIADINRKLSVSL